MKIVYKQQKVNYRRVHDYECEIRDRRTPVECFSIKYDMPMRLAMLLIGHTERETEQNMRCMEEFIMGIKNAVGGEHGHHTP